VAVVERHLMELEARERLDGVALPDYGPGVCAFCDSKVRRTSPPVPNVPVRVCDRCRSHDLVPPGWAERSDDHGNWIELLGPEAEREREAFLAAHTAAVVVIARSSSGVVTVGEKVCTRCGESKPVTAFFVKRCAKVGRSSACRECAGRDLRLRRYGRAEKLSPEELREAQSAGLRRWRAEREAA